MNILLTNDDGIHAPGLLALYKQFKNRHIVTVVAPDRERSAVGHAITLHEPLHANKVQIDGDWSGYAVNGTPVDCIKLGLVEIMNTVPDIVISGINPGANVGVNINYSGTVAAAKEAALYGIIAVAVSLQVTGTPQYEAVAACLEGLTEYICEKGLPFGTILNINFPTAGMEDVAGIRIVRQGISRLSESFEKRRDPRNRTYYWYGIETEKIFDGSEIDSTALGEKYITITPIQCDSTDYTVIGQLKNWPIEKKLFPEPPLRSVWPPTRRVRPARKER